MVIENEAKLINVICLAKPGTLENREFCHRSVLIYLGKSENEQAPPSLNTFVLQFER